MNKPRIFIVEDETVVSKDIHEQLVKLGYEPVGCTAHGERALELVGQLRPDLVLMDIRLAGDMDGIAAAHSIQEQCALPVVFLTAHADEPTLARAKIIGAHGYILKPFTDRELRATIEMVLFKHGTELKLQRTEERLRLVLLGSRDGFWDKDLISNTAFYSAFLPEFLGYAPDELPLEAEMELSLMHPDDAVSFRQQLAQVLAGATEHYEHEVRMRHKAGHHLPLLVRGVVIRDASGRAIRLAGTFTDLSERKRAEARLLEKTDLFHKQADQAPMMIWMAGLDKGCNFFNQGWLDYTGRTLAQEQGNGWAEGVHPEDLSRCLEIYTGHFDARQKFTMDYRLRNRDGEFHWLRDVGVPRLDGEGTFLGFIGSCIDIDDMRRAEVKLAEKEHRLRTIFETEPEGVVVVGPMGELLEINPAGLAMFEAASPGDMLGHSLSGFLLPGYREIFGDLHQRALNGERGLVEFQITGRRGTRRWLESHATPMPDTQGYVRLVLCILRDITPRKQAEDELRKLTRTIEQAPLSIIMTDLTGAIEYTNPQFTLVSGYTPDEVRGQNPRLLKSGHTAPQVYQDMWATLTAGCVWRGELLNRRKNGELFWELVVMAPILGPEGVATHYVALKEDISAEKATQAEKAAIENQLRQSQKLDAIGQLAGGIAHDFNNLLTGVLGNVALLEDEALPAGTQELIGQIKQAGQQAAGLTRQLLIFSHRQEPLMLEIELNGTIAEMAKLLQRILGEAVNLHFHYALKPQFIQADAGMIDQIILNLAVNARDAMPHGGNLTMSTESVAFEPDAEKGGLSEWLGEARRRGPGRRGMEGSNPTMLGAQPGSFTCFTVVDEGCGMTPEVCAHIFEPFYTTKEMGKGTGLGLATVYGIVQLHHGGVEVESRPGVGSTFRIYLPQLKTAPVPAAPVPAAPVPAAVTRGGGTILVVEDEPAVRQLLCACLQNAGYRVLESPSGVAALQLWPQHRAEVDLLITDMVMPEGVSGVQLAQALRTERPDLKIILISGYNARIDRERMQLGADVDFMPKPFNLQDVLLLVQARLNAKATQQVRPAAPASH